MAVVPSARVIRVVQRALRPELCCSCTEAVTRSPTCAVLGMFVAMRCVCAVAWVQASANLDGGRELELLPCVHCAGEFAANDAWEQGGCKEAWHEGREGALLPVYGIAVAGQADKRVYIGL